MQRLPLVLTTLRLVLGPLAIWAAMQPVHRLWFLPILLGGLFTDFFDGVLARHLGVSTPSLRRYDSSTDVVFWLSILGAAQLVSSDLLAGYWGWIAVLLGAEVACIAISLVRFRRMPATHSYAAKFYGLTLATTFCAIIAFHGPGWTVPVLITVGLLANTEVILILCLACTAPVDVPSISHLPRG